MKKIYERFTAFICAVIIVLTFIPSNVIAVTSTEKEDYKMLPTVPNVSVNKEFSIKFNKELDYNYVNANYIKVFDEKNNNIYVSVLLDSTRKIILVKPIYSYTQGSKYYITVDKKIKSKDGKTLSKSLKMYFTVNNLFAGLPYEKGLILVDNTAYAVDYLANNSRLRNELISKDYSIFYCYEPTKQKITNIFGNIDITGKNKGNSYDVTKPITYIDENGNEHIYKWNKDKSEFELVVPYVDAMITVNSSARVIMIELQKVYGLEGAAYFKPEHSSSAKAIGDKVAFTSTSGTEKVSILSSDNSVLGDITLVTTYSTQRKAYLNLKKQGVEGNSIGNIINNGYAVKSNDGYIYYNNTGDGNKLYKLDTNGMFNYAVSEDNGQYINVVEDWIYYSNYSDGGKLYKIKTDGSQKIKVVDDMAAYVTVSSKWIYYSNHSDKGRIYRVDKAGVNIERDRYGNVHGKPLTPNQNDESAYLNVSGEWIYYTNISDRHRPYVINENGTYRAKLSEEWADALQLYGDWVYYSNGNGVLSKVRKDGSKDTVLINGQASQFDKGFHLNVFEDWLYYSNYKDNGKLYKIKTDGSGIAVKINDSNVTYINIVGDWIYFVSAGKLYRLPMDATSSTKAEQIGKNTATGKVIKMDDLDLVVAYEEVNKPIEWIEAKYLPEKIAGIMDDNTMHQFVVQWDTKNVTIRNGVRTYVGNVLSHNRKVKLNLTIPSEMLNETNSINVYNNPDTNSGIIEVSNTLDNNIKADPPRLEMGDEISLYDDKDCKRLLKKSTVSRQGMYNKAIFTGLNLDKFGQQSYWMTIIRSGKSQSKPTEIKQIDVPIIVDVEKPNPNKTYLQIDGRDFAINKCVRPQVNNIDSSYLYNIYILQNGQKLDLNNTQFKPVGTVTKYTSYAQESNLSWIGDKTAVTDSKGTGFKNGDYSIYVAAKFKGTAGVDNRNMSPVVEGWACSNTVKLSAKEEKLPVKPTLKSQLLRGGEEVTIDRAPANNEIAYLVPVQPVKINGNDVDLLSIAKKWLAENEREFPLDPINGRIEFRDLLQKGVISRLVGDGSIKTMPAPLGSLYNPLDLDVNKFEYCPDKDYKLIIVNRIGASLPADGNIIVDNKPPVIDEDYLKFNSNLDLIFNAGYRGNDRTKNSTLYLLSKFEDGDIYLVNTQYFPSAAALLNSKEALENAFKEKLAYKYPVRKSMPSKQDTRGIKASISNNSKNYMMVAVDKVGNLSNRIDLCIWVDVSILEEYINNLDSALNKEGAIADKDKSNLEKLKNDAQNMLFKAKNDVFADAVSQEEIDRMVENLARNMVSAGVPAKNYLPQQALDAAKNNIKNIKNFDTNEIIDISNIRCDRLNLPSVGGFENEFKIKWISDNPTIVIKDDVIDTSRKIGEVTRPSGLNPTDKTVKLTAEVFKANDESKTLGVSTFYLNVKALTFEINPSNNELLIDTKDLQVNPDSDIKVEIYNGSTLIGNSVDFAGSNSGVDEQITVTLSPVTQVGANLYKVSFDKVSLALFKNDEGRDIKVTVKHKGITEITKAAKLRVYRNSDKIIIQR